MDLQKNLEEKKPVYSYGFGVLISEFVKVHALQGLELVKKGLS
jgi:hypothetical protein